MIKRILSYVFILLVFTQFIFSNRVLNAKPIEIDTPLKAAALYFPTPAILRCLNHSNIPKEFRKVIIQRQIKIPNVSTRLKQNILIGVRSSTKSTFVITGTITDGVEIIKLKIDPNKVFGLTSSGEKPIGFFGLEDLIGVQRRIRFKDTFGNQKLNYEVYLKTTKGKIGGKDYKLELFGQDKVQDGEVRYFLDGKGKLGEHTITVSARDTAVKDNYEIYEKYGPIEAFSTVSVYE